jgi:hypothetical protein
VNRHKSPQFVNRLGMVLHAQVYNPIKPKFACWLGADDKQGRGLFAATVSSFPLRGVQRSEETRGEVPLGPRKGFYHRAPNRLPRHQVRLSGNMLADTMTGCRKTAFAGVNGDTPLYINHGDLPIGGSWIKSDKRLERVRRALPMSHQF